jgi:hypothetical protein
VESRPSIIFREKAEPALMLLGIAHTERNPATAKLGAESR